MAGWDLRKGTFKQRQTVFERCNRQIRKEQDRQTDSKTNTQ